MKIKQIIPDLYRSEWLDVANFVFISACINCGHSAEEGIKKFQAFLNLGEAELDTDSLKTSYYRSQRKFIEAMRNDRENILVQIEPEVTRNDLKEMVREVIDEIVVKDPVLILNNRKRKKLSRKYAENQTSINFKTTKNCFQH